MLLLERIDQAFNLENTWSPGCSGSSAPLSPPERLLQKMDDSQYGKPFETFVIRPMKWPGSESGGRLEPRPAARVAGCAPVVCIVPLLLVHTAEQKNCKNIAFVLPVFVLETKDV